MHRQFQVLVPQHNLAGLVERNELDIISWQRYYFGPLIGKSLVVCVEKWKNTVLSDWLLSQQHTVSSSWVFIRVELDRHRDNESTEMANQNIIDCCVEIANILPDWSEHRNCWEVTQLMDIEGAVSTRREYFRELLYSENYRAMEVTELLTESIIIDVKNKEFHVSESRYD